METTIRLRTLDDDPQIVAIRVEANPDLPPITVEEYRYNADPANSTPSITERYVAEKDGRLLGLYVLTEMSNSSRPNTYAANIGVASRDRRKGVGSQLFDHMLDRAGTHGATRVYGNIAGDAEDAISFSERRGFTKTGREMRMSKLLLEGANLDGYEGVVEKVRESGIDIKTLAEIGLDDEPFLRRLCDVANTSAHDIPSTEQFNDFPFEYWVKFLDSPGNSPEQVWVALDGENPVGIATLGLRGDDAAFNNYTGVAREYRGRGVARALKLKTVEWARAKGINAIFTGNDMENQRMLSINIPMGYKAVPSQVELVRDV